MHGRLITDNVLVAYEIMHHISQNKSGRMGDLALKLDMSKAYDRVEWIWLEKIMQKLGFDNNWCALIMKCITTVSYSMTCRLMESLKGILFQVGELGKVIHYLLIYSCYVRKDFLLLLRKRWRMEGWGELQFAIGVPKYHIFSLLMII